MERAEKSSRDRVFDTMELPAALREACWNDFKDNSTGEKIAPYLKKIRLAIESGDGLFLMGDVRSGKSYLSAYVGKVLRSFGYSVQFISAEEMQQRVMDKKLFYQDVLYFDRFRDVDVLIIDDFGKEIPLAKFRPNFVLSTIKHRDMQKKLTIINSSYLDHELDKVYGEGYSGWFSSRFLHVVLDTSWLADLTEKYK